MTAVADKRIPTAVYCRLSRENEDSIETQENFIKLYLHGHKDEGFDYFQSYIDDGHTGTNFNRPETAKYYCQYHTGKKAKGEPLEKRPEIIEEALKQICAREYNKFRERVLNHQWTPEVLVKGTIFDDDFNVTTEELKRKIEELNARKTEYNDLFAILYERRVRNEITKEEFMELRDELVDEYHPLELDRKIRNANLQELEFRDAELIRESIELTVAPMSEFDETAFMRATNFVELNPDGSLHILFSDEEAFKLNLDIAYDRIPDE